MTATGVWSSFNSVRIRHSTGKAVMAIATPIKSIYTPNSI
jgi:hypothetical protein